MQLAEHQKARPDGAPLSLDKMFFMEISGSVSHCAPRASGKITMVPVGALGLLLAIAHAEAMICHDAYIKIPVPR